MVLFPFLVDGRVGGVTLRSRHVRDNLQSLLLVFSSIVSPKWDGVSHKIREIGIC